MGKAYDNIVTATVVSCDISETKIRGMLFECYEIGLEFSTPNGIVHKSLKRGTPMDIGSAIQVYYNPKDDTIEMPENIKNKTNIPSRAIKVIVAIFISAFLVIFFYKAFEYNDKAAAHLLAICMCMVFVFIGFYVIVCGYKKRRVLSECDIVPGSVVSYTVRNKRGIFPTYESIYEYQYKGEAHKVGAISSGIRKEPLGNQVNIAVNRETHEAFCVEELRKYFIMGAIFAIAGLLLTGGCIWIYFC